MLKMKSPGVSIFRRVVKWWPWRLAMISLLLFAAFFFIYGHKDLAKEKPITKRNFTLDGHKDLATEKPISGRNFALDGHKDLATEKPISGRNFTLGGGMAVKWEGFGPEKGVYNFTVVTAMLDIGRGQWSQQSRSYNTYLLYMQRVLRLDVNMVIFVDAKARPFVDWMRRGRQSRTHVVEKNFKDLPYYAHRDRVQEIMNSDEYRKDNELVKNKLCESLVPEYDILQWSKLYFVNEAIDRNPFRNDFFVWLDGGYGHGEDVHPPDGIWKPKNLFEHSDKVTFIEREPVEKYRTHADRLHKMSINIIAGLFFGGGRRAFQRLYALQQELIADWLKRGIVDDDQTTYMLMYYKEPQLFHLVRGNWNDVFRLFNSNKKT